MATSEGPFWAMVHHIAKAVTNPNVVAKPVTHPGRVYSSSETLRTFHESEK